MLSEDASAEPQSDPPRTEEASPSDGAPEPRAEPLGRSTKKKRSFWKELPVLIVIAFVVALLIKTFLVQAFFIPSASMEPELMVGDRVLVEKVSGWWDDVSRGDVVVFEREVGVGMVEEPDEPFWTDISNAFRSLFGFPTAGSQDFIKRVIAIEGDVVKAEQGVVYINGEPIDEPYLPEGTQTSDFGRVKIGEDEIFVMGDNRANSDDSRSFGPIPEGTVVGKAFLLIWPPSDFGTV